MRLSDRVVIVTGAGRGIGRAYALGLAAEGARVVAADVLDCKPVGTEIETRGGQALAVACDVSREADTQRLATETLARFGRIDALVNNAALYGNLERRPFMEIPVEEWDLVGTLVYLVSDDSAFMSGQTLLVDGGGSVH